MADRPMKRIPIRAAERIAKDYGYDQVIIIARRVGEDPEPYGEHLTTYGINKVHCDVAARTGSFIQHKIMGWPWPKQIAVEPLYRALKRLHGWGKEQMNRLGSELQETGAGREMFDEVEAALNLYEKGQA
jgi:hypothetical protein